jgi:hypothetical protein
VFTLEKEIQELTESQFPSPSPESFLLSLSVLPFLRLCNLLSSSIGTVMVENSHENNQEKKRKR